MSQYFEIHPVTPQARLVKRAVEIIRAGGVIAYPTDSSYALGCGLGEKQAVDRIRQIRRLRGDHNFALACRDLSDIGTYARVENYAYRLLKSHTPGPYTFILKATSKVPRLLQHPKKKTIGIRVPDHPTTQAILEELGEPLMTVSLIMPDDDMPMTDPVDIRGALEHQVDAVIDGGPGGLEPSTVVDLSGDAPRVLREGAGDPSIFEG